MFLVFFVTLFSVSTMGPAKNRGLTVCQNCCTAPKIHPSIFIATKIGKNPSFLLHTLKNPYSMFSGCFMPCLLHSGRLSLAFHPLGELAPVLVGVCQRAAQQCTVLSTVPSLGEKSAEGISGYPCVALHVVFYAPCYVAEAQNSRFHFPFLSQRCKNPYFISVAQPSKSIHPFGIPSGIDFFDAPGPTAGLLPAAAVRQQQEFAITN